MNTSGKLDTYNEIFRDKSQSFVVPRLEMDSSFKDFILPNNHEKKKQDEMNE